MIRGGRLRFKGDSSRTRKPQVSAVERPLKIVVEEDPTPINAWSLVDGIKDIHGPIVLYCQGSDRLLACASAGGRLSAMPLDASSFDDLFEPSDVSLIFLGHPAASSPKDRITLKSSHGRFFSSDPHGEVLACREAVGPCEEWTLEESGGQSFRLCNRATGWYLSLCGEDVRADVHEAGPMETFLLKCQTIHKARKQSSGPQQLTTLDSQKSLRHLEEEESRRYQSWKPQTLSTSKPSTAYIDEERLSLEKADKEGRLRETLLDRRMKRKHDPFC